MSALIRITEQDLERVEAADRVCESLPHAPDLDDLADRMRAALRVAFVIRQSNGSIQLDDDDLMLLAMLSKTINRTAYHGGLDVWRSDGSINMAVGKFIGLIDRILGAHNTSVEKLIP